MAAKSPFLIHNCASGDVSERRAIPIKTILRIGERARTIKRLPTSRRTSNTILPSSNREAGEFPFLLPTVSPGGVFPPFHQEMCDSVGVCDIGAEVMNPRFICFEIRMLYNFNRARPPAEQTRYSDFQRTSPVSVLNGPPNCFPLLWRKFGDSTQTNPKIATDGLPPFGENPLGSARMRLA